MQLQPICDLKLLEVLKAMLADLIEADNHWMVSAYYLEYLDADYAGRRLYLAPVHFHVDSAWQVLLAERGIELDALMIPRPDGRRVRIRVPYDQIYNVGINCKSGTKLSLSVVNHLLSTGLQYKLYFSGQEFG